MVNIEMDVICMCAGQCNTYVYTGIFNADVLYM